MLRDLKSVNGTYVNEERVQGEVVIHEGDQVRIGSLLFAVNIKPAFPVAPLPSRTEVQWLLDSPVEAPDVQLGGDTSCEMIIPEEVGDQESKLPERSVERTRGRELADMSAGQYLRDFFCQS